jgi:hypothetical protein
MLGLVITVVFAVPAAFPSAPAAGFTCDASPSSACDQAPDAADQAPDGANQAPDGDGLQYATEAVIDCPTPADDALAAAGECDGTVRDASYRASRDPESERLPGSLRPARRDRGTAGMRAACAGVPVEGHDGLSSPAPTQPLALFAVPALQTFSSSRFSFASPAALTSRGIRPLERPPRA